MVVRRPTRAANNLSDSASADVRRPGTDEGSCRSRLLAGWTDNLGSCLSRWCCSRTVSVRGHNAPEVSSP